MPLQNRVRPDGVIIATPEHGLYMGNRGGQFHRDDRTLKRRHWASRAWITCLLQWKGRQEIIMAPNHYTQLFFLDEATALSAGHRPCALCRRADYDRFRGAWISGHGLPSRPLASEMDEVLHHQRLTPEGVKRVARVPAGTLCEGAFLQHEGAPHLLWKGALRPWTPAGYGGQGLPVPPDGEAVLLTPPAVLAVLRAGYRPAVHPSAAE